MSSEPRIRVNKADLTTQKKNEPTAVRWKRISSEEREPQPSIEESEVGPELKRKIRRVADNDRAEPLYITHV